MGTTIYCPISQRGNVMAYFADKDVAEWVVEHSEYLVSVGELRATHPNLRGETKEAYLCSLLRRDILLGSKGKPSKETRRFAKRFFPGGLPKISYKIEMSAPRLLTIRVGNEEEDLLLSNANWDGKFPKRLEKWKRKHFTTTS